MRLINGYQVSQALHVAATLGVADRMNDGAIAIDDLASAVGANPRSLYRVMRALAAAGVFAEDDMRRFSLTELGQVLRADHPLSPAAWAINIGQHYFWETWGHLLDGVRSGEHPFRARYGTDVWTYRAGLPDESAVFDAAMTALSRMSSAATIAAYDFSRYARIVDVGGGRGAFLAAVLAANAGVRGVVFDQPHVVDGAPATLADAGVADRCESVGGDMFASVPAGADAYVMRHVLHDWEDDECRAILRVVRAAIPASGRLLILDQLIAPPNSGMQTKFSDLNMLVMAGGEERTEAEFAALFAASGFKLTSVTRTASPTCVIEAALA